MMTDRWFPEIRVALTSKDASQRCPNASSQSHSRSRQLSAPLLFWATPEIIARVRRLIGGRRRFGSKGSHLQLPRRVNARSHASIQPWGESLPHGRRRTIPWHERTERRWIPRQRYRMVRHNACTHPKILRPTTVPNGFFLGANVINISRQTARIMVMNIRVRLDDLPTIPVMTSEIEEYRHHDHPAVTNPMSGQSACISVMSYLTTQRCVLGRTHIVKKEGLPSGEPEVTLGVYAIVGKFASGPAWPVGCYDGAAGRSGGGG